MDYDEFFIIDEYIQIYVYMILIYRFTLTTLWKQEFAQEIWCFLLSRLHDIEKCALAMAGLERKTRIYHLKKHPNCFVGKEAVSFLVDYSFVSNRDDAVNLG